MSNMKPLLLSAAVLALSIGVTHARIIDLDAPANAMDELGAPAHVRAYATPDGGVTREIGSYWVAAAGPMTLSLDDQGSRIPAIGSIPETGVATALDAKGVLTVAIPGRYQFRLRVHRNEIFATHCTASIQIDGLRVLQSAALASAEVMLTHGDYQLTVSHECSNDDLAAAGPTLNETTHVEIRSVREDWRPLDWSDLGLRAGRKD